MAITKRLQTAAKSDAGRERTTQNVKASLNVSFNLPQLARIGGRHLMGDTRATRGDAANNKAGRLTCASSAARAYALLMSEWVGGRVEGLWEKLKTKLCLKHLK